MTSGSLQGLKSPGLGQGEDLLLTQLLSTALPTKTLGSETFRNLPPSPCSLHTVGQ